MKEFGCRPVCGPSVVRMTATATRSKFERPTVFSGRFENIREGTYVGGVLDPNRAAFYPPFARRVHADPGKHTADMCPPFAYGRIYPAQVAGALLSSWMRTERPISITSPARGEDETKNPGQSNSPVTCQQPRPVNGNHIYLLHRAKGVWGRSCVKWAIHD